MRIRLGYSASVWDARVAQFAPAIFRKVRANIGLTGTEDEQIMRNNPIVEWYTNGPFLPKRCLCGHETKSAKQILEILVWPFTESARAVTEILTGDREKFSFLVKSYTVDCFWWELVEYIRKFLLSGALFAQLE
eukprot:SAG11_NODE_235_length_11852_cov_4.266020_18_plen_134_part_00